MSGRWDRNQGLIYGVIAAGAIAAAAAAGAIWSRKWALQVRFADGTTDFLRNGRVAGEGPVAWFRFRREAEEILQALRPALADHIDLRVARHRRT
jgi:hypothetical protein